MLDISKEAHDEMLRVLAEKGDDPIVRIYIVGHG